MATLRAVLFDVFGTLLDVHSVSARAEQLFPGQGDKLATVWRHKQIEYTRLRTLSAHYVPFARLTEDALLWAGESLGLNVDRAACGLLMHEYTQLTPFADVRPALDRLRAADVTMGVLSNGDPGLLDDALHGAQIGEYFDLVLSADAVHAYKTAPAVYELGPRNLNQPAEEILFVSSNGWDAIGAQWFGYVSYWVNRRKAPAERLGVQPASGAALGDAVDFFLRSKN
jgi:2-haloacid dehalogenase